MSGGNSTAGAGFAIGMGAGIAIGAGVVFAMNAAMAKRQDGEGE